MIQRIITKKTYDFDTPRSKEIKAGIVNEEFIRNMIRYLESYPWWGWDRN